MQKILIVEDEKAIVDILKFHLVKSGYKVLEAYNGLEAIQIAEKEQPDLILLDVMIPEMNGFEVCTKIRSNMIIPIIMLTAREDVTDKILGLSLGADDYISKPFNIREVLARIDANLRRVELQSKDVKSPPNKMNASHLEINRDSFEVISCGQVVELTTREYELLEFFMIHPNKVFSREELLNKVWQYEYFGDLRTVDVTISRLREKIESGHQGEKHIFTKRGFGYYFK